MHQAYVDIRMTMGTPLWWDEYGVPRYQPFDPKWLNDIYADECCLLEISCQNCGKKFKVAMSQSKMGRMDFASLLGLDDTNESFIKMSLRCEVEEGTIHYGDPPNVGCCSAGPTMNCLDLEVLEFWELQNNHKWERVGELEKKLPDGITESPQTSSKPPIPE